MVAAALTSLSFTANTPKYVALTSLIGVVTAGILLLARILKLGFLRISCLAPYWSAFCRA